MLAKANKVL
jgi:Ca2+-binding EF-hand superfamily protein